MIKNYENVYILKGSLTEEQALKEIEIIKSYFKGVETYEKENDQNGYLGRKKLAYSIKGEEYGYYYLTHFRVNVEKMQKIVEKIQKIETNLRLNDNVMKFYTVRLEG